MASKEKIKGNRVEREVVGEFVGKGIEAKRAWGSDGKSLGLHSEVDCVALINNTEFKIQVKARKKIGKLYLPDTDKVDAHVVKMDRHKLVIILELEKFIEVINND